VRVGWPSSSTKSTVSTAWARVGIPKRFPGEESISIPSNASAKVLQCRESLGRTTFVVAEPQPQYAQPVLRAVLDGGEIYRVQSESGPLTSDYRGGQPRLAEDRGEYRSLDRHRQREPARQAHADRADPGTTALGMCLGGERAQPVHDRARSVGEDPELTRHAYAQHGL